MPQQANPQSSVWDRILGARPNLFALVDINTNPLPDGAVCWVSDQQANFRYYRDDTTPPNGVTVIAPTSGPGRWMRDAGGFGVALGELTFVSPGFPAGFVVLLGLPGAWTDLVVPYTPGLNLGGWVDDGGGILRWTGPAAFFELDARITFGEDDGLGPYPLGVAFAIDSGVGFVTDLGHLQGSFVTAAIADLMQNHVTLKSYTVLLPGQRVRLQAAQFGAGPGESLEIQAIEFTAKRLA